MLLRYSNEKEIYLFLLVFLQERNPILLRLFVIIYLFEQNFFVKKGSKRTRVDFSSSFFTLNNKLIYLVIPRKDSIICGQLQCLHFQMTKIILQYKVFILR